MATNLLVAEVFINRSLQTLSDLLAGYRLEVSGTKNAIDNARVIRLLLRGHWRGLAWLRSRAIEVAGPTRGRHGAVVARRINVDGREPMCDRACNVVGPPHKVQGEPEDARRDEQVVAIRVGLVVFSGIRHLGNAGCRRRWSRADVFASVEK